MHEYEVIVIGGGPAGLSAALYLARFKRRAALCDCGYGRSTWNQMTHNYLGFPGGIAAHELRRRGYAQLGEYPDIHVFHCRIDTLRHDEDRFVAGDQATTWEARAVILCTGVVDHYPRFEGWQEYVGRSMFWCITCDGYGTQGKRVVVVGNNNQATALALQLQRFTDQIVLLTNSQDHEISPDFQQRLLNAQIPLLCDEIVQVEGQRGMFQRLYLRSGACLELDQLFAHQGATPQTALAVQVEVELSDNGYILVDSEQKTNLSGFFAAGDVTSLHSHQFSTAVHEGGMAAQAANYYLYPPELRDD
jgi:thioredoxin reductase (NADPH)